MNLDKTVDRVVGVHLHTVLKHQLRVATQSRCERIDGSAVYRAADSHVVLVQRGSENREKIIVPVVRAKAGSRCATV